MIRTFVAASLLVLCAAPTAAQTGPLAGFDDYVQNAMREWKVPGVALAIIRGDSVVLAKGYGVRTLDRPEAVDANTVFAIGSASKAFTATLVGMLVDEGKVKWDDPVTTHLPGFQLYDPYVTRELAVRDLLSHRSGLARGDLLWYGTTNDASEILRRVRFLKPSWSFRSQYGYQNIMYVAAGQIVANKTGKSWDAAVRDRLLVPLGMTVSNTSTHPLRTLPNVASPHADIEDTVRVISWRNIDNAGPAGSINSSANDMTRWVRFQLDSAKVGRKQLVSTAAFTETHTPHVVIRRDSTAREANPFTHFSSYGLGWSLADYRGRELVHHGGNIDGMSALVALMPGEDIGMVILTNMNGSGLPTVLMRRAFDALLGAPPRDWSAELLRLRDRTLARAKETERKREAERVKGTRPSLPLSAYVGTYADSMYGEAKVRKENGRLVVEFGPSFVGDMEHWHFNSFRTRWRDRSRGKGWVNFTIGSNAKVRQMEIENIADFRRQEKADTTPGVRLTQRDLARLAGSYRGNEAALTATVEMVGDGLKITVPGGPAYTAVSVTPARFRLTGEGMRSGLFADFKLEGNGVRSMTLEQPAPQPRLTFGPM
ncbi:MAG: serine hydrolase [Gemmatimonadetes bacterium]|nr:serine hydrolase [Gemmatimonadota bacterium]